MYLIMTETLSLSGLASFFKVTITNCTGQFVLTKPSKDLGSQSYMRVKKNFPLHDNHRIFDHHSCNSNQDILFMIFGNVSASCMNGEILFDPKLRFTRIFLIKHHTLVIMPIKISWYRMPRLMIVTGMPLKLRKND